MGKRAARVHSHLVRQHWLAIVLLVAVHAFSNAIAQTDTSSHRDLNPPQGLSNNSSLKVDATIPSLGALASEDCSSPAVNPTEGPTESEKSFQGSNLSSSEDDGINEYQKKLAEAIAKRTDSIEAPLRAKIERLESEKARLLNETNAELVRLEVEVERQKRRIERLEKEKMKLLNETNTELDRLEEQDKRQQHQLKTKEDRYQDSRRQFLKVDAELRHMHKAAVSQYVNFTLMKEDAWDVVRKTIAKTCHGVDRRWGREYRRIKSQMRPRIRDADRRLTAWSRDANSSLRPKMMSLQRDVRLRWSRSTILRPLLESSVDTVAGPARNIYARYEPAIDEVKTACRLSAISAIEEASKIALGFLEWDEKMKLKELEREEKMKRDPAQRRLEKRRKRGLEPNHKDYAPPKKDARPSVINLKARVFFRHTLANSERLFEEGLALVPLAIALSISSFRIFLLGSFLIFVRAPAQLIWLFVTVANLLGRKK